MDNAFFEYSYRNMNTAQNDFWTMVGVGFIVSMVLASYCFFPSVRRLEHQEEPSWPIAGLLLPFFLMLFFAFLGHQITFPTQIKKIRIQGNQVTFFYAYPFEEITKKTSDFTNISLIKGRMWFQTKENRMYRSHVVFFKKQKKHLQLLRLYFQLKRKS